MKRSGWFAGMLMAVLWCLQPALADVGVTDDCQDDIKELQDRIDDNKDDYTSESRRKAKNHLLAARTNRLNPVKCRQNILEARAELQKGRRDRKKD
jgi:hypothetical protein